MQTFDDLASLTSRFRDLGATRIFFKPLSENDNSKQQVYLGGSFEVLTFFPYGEVRAEPGHKEQTFKAPLALYWVDPTTIERAPSAQLILYPRYPEVRLSGFLSGCKDAPGEHLRPIPKDQRQGIDRRILFFGTTADGRTLAALAPSESPLAAEAAQAGTNDSGVFRELQLPATPAGNSREIVLARLREIQLMGPVPSQRLNKDGESIPYNARNGGGYTLEALLGIRPNGDAEPDFMGWEIKAFGGDRITLMTPEPNGGFYGEQGVGAFVRRYGRLIASRDQRYFTGMHYVGKANATTGMTLGLAGFDIVKNRITDVTGRIVLHDANGAEAASWSFTQLLTHWNRKHASAMYVPYSDAHADVRKYRYINPVLVGERTDFSRYLTALAHGSIVFDPGSKIDGLSTAKPKVKARSQFRMRRKFLASLYDHFLELDLNTAC